MKSRDVTVLLDEERAIREVPRLGCSRREMIAAPESQRGAPDTASRLCQSPLRVKPDVQDTRYLVWVSLAHMGKREPRTNVYAHSESTQTGRDFLKEFLRSGVFTRRALRALAPKGRLSAQLDVQTDAIVYAWEENNYPSANIVRALCRQPATYLALRKGTCARGKALRDIEKMLTSFGEDGWYGPVHDDDAVLDANTADKQLNGYFELAGRVGEDDDEDDDDEDDVPVRSLEPEGRAVTYYVYCREIEHRVVIAETPSGPRTGPQRLRWSIIARVTDDSVSFHWDGFMYSTLQNGNKQTFPYWNHVDAAIDELRTQLNADWDRVNLYTLVYKTLWNRYAEKPTHAWNHLGINAEDQGVALRANSTSDDEEKKRSEIEGLRKFTGTLAASICSKEKISATRKADISRIILHGMIREWGTRNYTFQINTKSGGKLFFGRVHMGSLTQGTAKYGSPDMLAHVHTYQSYRGTIHAARFLLRHL